MEFSGKVENLFMPVLIRYCLLAIWPPFVVATLITLGVLDLLFYTRDFIDYLFVKHAGVANSFRLLLYIQPSFLVLAIPIGYLTSVLVVYGRLSADRELIAVESCGISPYLLFWPMIGFSLLMSVFLVFFMDTTLPWGNISFLKLQYKILSERTSIAVHSGTFIKDFNGYVLYVGEKDDKSDTLKRVVVQLVNEVGYPYRVIISQQGTLGQDAKTAHFLLRLENGTLQQLGEHARPDPGSLVQIKFEDCVLDLDSKQIQNGSGNFDDPRSMHIQALGARIRDERSKKMDTRYDEVEFHKKFSIPFSALAFAFIGVPLGMRARSGSFLSPILAVILVVVYELFIMYGQVGGPMGSISPFWAMWLPNLFLTLVGFALLPYFLSRFRFWKTSAVPSKDRFISK
jgi:lipopolysaccharide export system permease protein